MALSLSDFTVESITFELRYPEAFKLWDRSGELTKNATSFRGKLIAAMPGQINFRKERLETAFELTAARFTQHHPEGSLDKVAEHADTLVKLVTTFLEVATFDRVGLRIQAFRKTDTASAAAQKILATKLMALPGIRSFDSESDGEPLLAEYAVRVRSKARGALVRLRSDERKIEIDPPPQVKTLDARVDIVFGVTLDVDQHTLAPMAAQQLVAGEWLLGALRLYRRDAGNFLGRN